MSQQAIIDKIISETEEQAAVMLAEAREKAAAITDAAEKERARALDAVHAGIERASREISERARTVAELDARKLLLSAKAALLDDVYAKALCKVRNMGKAEYKKLAAAMLENAQNGDVVTVSPREKGIVTKKLVADVAKEKGISLSLADGCGDFDGGMVLSGAGVDKNMSFEVEFALLREETEAETARKLFG